MANYEVILDQDNSIMTIINLDTWACFAADESNGDYRDYAAWLQAGGVPIYMGGDESAPNYPGAPAPEPEPTPSDTPVATDGQSGDSTPANA